MSSPNSERIETIVKPRRGGFSGSRTFREIQREMSSLPNERKRAVYGLAVMLSGVEHVRRSLSKRSADSKEEAAMGVKEFVMGAERTVDAILTGVLKRVERIVEEELRPLRDEIQEARELRAKQTNGT